MHLYKFFLFKNPWNNMLYFYVLCSLDTEPGFAFQESSDNFGL